MKYIKASICSIIAFSMLPYIQSSENLDPLFAELKRTKRVRNLTGREMSEIERNEGIDNSFKEIENKIFHGDPLPEPLKKLYKECGNLRLSVGILSPIGGVTSPLHDGIREGQEKKIPSNWVVFAEITGCEYFCIHRFEFQIARFLVFPESKPHDYKQCDTYSNFGEWIKKELL